MKRRAFLGTVGSLGSLGVIGYTSRSPVETLEIRFWLSEQAATYDGVPDRIREYLQLAFDLEFWTLEVSFGGTVPVSTEDGANVTIHGEWPSRVVAGYFGRGEITPVADVNLLVTDGQMRTAPTGYGIPHIASVGGARHIAELEPVEFGDRYDVVPYRTPERVMQVLVHEAGHALGLNHDHGVTFRKGDAVTASPMLSAYAWDPEYDGDRSSCGTVYPETDDLGRKLTFSFSACAQRRLEGYQGGFTRK
ncbi:peptidase M10A and M12B matrixin and adamalysin [Natronoglomus mannanivorans]|uniref:Peptidase M10A and M12B matrixin and adamalysin n=1 Tax=Natronoglomus mannanivorans TaxID=2979990 RepID=A0AAP3E1G6_9EURY|nr:peptidase M10A and M12B matrixin and adamalysin [Halobacteria archaeon AArc-xg1-1]